MWRFLNRGKARLPSLAHFPEEGLPFVSILSFNGQPLDNFRSRKRYTTTQQLAKVQQAWPPRTFEFPRYWRWRPSTLVPVTHVRWCRCSLTDNPVRHSVKRESTGGQEISCQRQTRGKRERTERRTVVAVLKVSKPNKCYITHDSCTFPMVLRSFAGLLVLYHTLVNLVFTTLVNWSILQVLLELCEHQPRCQVRAESTTFRQDPCPATSKYLEVHYKCRPSESSTTLLVLCCT